MINSSFDNQPGSYIQDQFDQPDAPKKSRKLWYILGGCGVLLGCAALVAVGLLLYFGPTLLGGNPMPARVPGNPILYMDMDLLKTQSSDINKIVNVFEQIAGQDPKNSSDSLDEYLGDNFDMTLTEDIVPWVGRYAALAVTDVDYNNGTGHYMLMVQSRSNGRADKFIQELIIALEKNQSEPFTQSKVSGINMYIRQSQYSDMEDMVIARVGNYVYLANSQDAILSSLHVQKAAALGSSKMYKNAMAGLPKNRLVSVYFDGNGYKSLLGQALQNSGSELAPFKGLEELGLGGMGMSMAIENEGLRFDFAVAFDENQLSAFQTETLKATYSNPKTDSLVPEDVFVYMGTNSSQSLARILQEGSPLYTQDVKDALDMLNQQSNIDIQKLISLLGGEYGFAIGPSNDSVFTQQSGPALGFVVLASTNDEAGMNDWSNSLLDTLSQDQYTEYSTVDTQIGRYSLKTLSIGSGGESVPTILYGADNGYLIVGTGQDLLEKGLNSKNTLANDATYRNTWKSFPAGSVPYLYLNTHGLVELVRAQSPSAISTTTANGLAKVPVMAVSLNHPAKFTQGFTIIIFITD
jgi:hypothetical protein